MKTIRVSEDIWVVLMKLRIDKKFKSMPKLIEDMLSVYVPEVQSERIESVR